MMNVQINNMPEYATHRKWIVCLVVDAQVWFYSAWPYHQEAEARAQALEVNGFVVENSAWLKGVFSR